MGKKWFITKGERTILRDNASSLECRKSHNEKHNYGGADKSLARPTSRCILSDGENISFDLVLLYIYI